MGSNVNSATVLAADDGRVLRRVHLRAHGHDKFTHACITPDGARLALATGSTLRIHDVDSGDPTVEIDHGLSWCYGIAFSPDGTCMATAADEGVYLWDAATGHPGQWLPTPATVATLRFSRCGHIVIAADRDHTVRGWDARTGVATGQLAAPADTQAVTFSLDGLLALIRTRRGTLQLWDIPTGREWAPPVEIGRGRAAGLDHARRTVATGSGREVKHRAAGPNSARSSAGPRRAAVPGAGSQVRPAGASSRPPQVASDHAQW